MNIFKYFDSLLSGKHSLLALKYSDSVEESLRKAYASKCAIEARSKVARDESVKECAICEHTFSEEYLTQVKLWMGKDKIVCRRCLLKNEKTICEKCGKAIASDDFLIYVLCPVLDFHYIEKAKEFFHDKNVSSAKVALDPIEFEDLCNNLGGSAYAKNFRYGKIICNECYEKLNFDKTLNTVIRRELCELPSLIEAGAS